MIPRFFARFRSIDRIIFRFFAIKINRAIACLIALISANQGR